jgi:hypothetical protein
MRLAEKLDWKGLSLLATLIEGLQEIPRIIEKHKMNLHQS